MGNVYMEEKLLDMSSMKRDSIKKPKPAFRFERIVDNFQAENKSQIRMADSCSDEMKSSWGYRFERTNSMMRHFHQKSKTDLFSCGECGWVFTELSDLLKHIADNHEPNPGKLRRKRSPTDMDNEEGHHAKLAKNIECDTIVQNDHFESHKQTHQFISGNHEQSKTDSFWCGKCGWVFTELSDAMKHVADNHEQNLAKLLENRSPINMDNEEGHHAKLAKNSECDTFVQNDHFESHKQGHQLISETEGQNSSENGMIPTAQVTPYPFEITYTCYHCGMIFPEKSHLIEHIQIHQFP